MLDIKTKGNKNNNLKEKVSYHYLFNSISSINFAVICSSLEDVWFEHPFSHFTACFHGNIHPLNPFEKQGPKYFFHFKYFFNLNEVFLLFLRKTVYQ